MQEPGPGLTLGCLGEEGKTVRISNGFKELWLEEFTGGQGTEFRNIKYSVMAAGALQF